MNLINMILAVDENMNYAKEGCCMPWSKQVSIKSGDMASFKNITISNSSNKKNVIIMGYKTWISIGETPLSNRYNIIIDTRNSTSNINNKKKMAGLTDTVFLQSLNECLTFIENKKIVLGMGNIFIIGGKSLWEECLERKLISNVYLTIIKDSKLYTSSKTDIKFDIFNNRRFLKDFHKLNTICDNDYSIIVQYYYLNKEEHIFLRTLDKIINKGVYKMDRSGVGTYSLFGKSFTYDIRNYRLPLFTHRKVFIRGIIEELLFFISGKTNTKSLEEKNVNIWKGHTSREYLNKVGLSAYEEGSYGPAYGFQLRHWGAEFEGDFADYHGKGFDQLNYIVDLLKDKQKRNSRRILFSYWNPSVLDKVPLPSCHLLYNFFVDPEKEELSVSFYQRSNDYALAGVFNIVSASILTFMLCKITGLKPAKCIHNIGDLHLYSNQIETVQEFMKNAPTTAFPFIQVNNKTKNGDDYLSMDNFCIDDFKVILYNSHKKYNIPFSV